jgi:hypothetical protein
VLARRARGQDHRQAGDLLEQIEPLGRNAAKALRELIDLKDTAHYGVVHITRPKLAAALRRARQLVEFATSTVR